MGFTSAVVLPALACLCAVMLFITLTQARELKELPDDGELLEQDTTTSYSGTTEQPQQKEVFESVDREDTEREGRTLTQTICQPGYVFSKAGACTPCQPGGYSPFPAGPTYCLCCAPGSIAPGNAATRCQVCPRGTYSDAEGPPISPSCYRGDTKCTPCPAGTTSLAGSGDISDCKSVPILAPTCFDITNPYFATTYSLTRLASGACAGHGLPKKLCLGSNYWTAPDPLYQMWYIMEDGAKVGPNEVDGSNRGNTLIGFLQTSDWDMCKWQTRDAVTYISTRYEEIRAVETCTSVNGTVITRNRWWRQTAPTMPTAYCTPALHTFTP